MLFKFVLGLFLFVALSWLAGRWLTNKALGDGREPTPQEAAEIAARLGPQVRAPSSKLPPAEPIEMEVSRAPRWDDLKWIIGLWFGALVLYGDPDVLWTRWLAWPLPTRVPAWWPAPAG